MAKTRIALESEVGEAYVCPEVAAAERGEQVSFTSEITE